MNTGGLAPRWASAPGETIASILEERNVKERDVAQQLHLSPSEFTELLAGRLSITLNLARSLAETLGATSEYWLAREAQYLDDRSRVAADQWSQVLPVRQMTQFGWIEKPGDWHQRITVCLNFFGVDDVESWDKRYKSQLEAALYRRSPSFSIEDGATAAWFRACEKEVESLENLGSYDAEQFVVALTHVRPLTRMKDPGQFIPKLRSICAGAGVAVAVVPAPRGCPLSGVARWYNNNPIVQLSARHLSDDHFWFTFFHEAGHVLRHDLNVAFIDMLDEGDDDDAYEREANEFASSFLSARDLQSVKPGSLSSRRIIQAAQSAGVSPGIVVGQLQHAGILPRNRFNRLKRYYVWNTTTLEIRERH